MKYKVVNYTNEDGSMCGSFIGDIIELEPIEEVNTEQDDSWKVKYNEWLTTPTGTRVDDFCNSKLKPWVDKVRELEFDIEEYRKQNALCSDKVRELEARNKSLVFDNNTVHDMMLKQAGKIENLQDRINRINQLINE